MLQDKAVATHPVWVLLEATHPIGEKFYQTLIELMPSVIKIFTSCDELIEILCTQKSLPYHLPCFCSNSYSEQEDSK